MRYRHKTIDFLLNRKMYTNLFHTKSHKNFNVTRDFQAFKAAQGSFPISFDLQYRSIKVIISCAGTERATGNVDELQLLQSSIHIRYKFHNFICSIDKCGLRINIFHIRTMFPS